jgi:hypothetical protein
MTTKRRRVRIFVDSSDSAPKAAADADADAQQLLDVDSDAPNILASTDIVHALASAALDKELSKRMRKRLAAGAPIAIVIGVPSSAWLDPIESAVRSLSPTARVITRDGAAKRQKTDAGNEVAEALVCGRPVVGISPAPDRALPPALNACADARLDIAQPDAKIMRGLLRRFARGRAPREMPAAPCASLSLHEIISCFRRGASASEVVAGFARLAARKAMANALDDTPTLDALPGFSGPARF